MCACVLTASASSVAGQKERGGVMSREGGGGHWWATCNSSNTVAPSRPSTQVSALPHRYLGGHTKEEQWSRNEGK